jgi:predicted O-linked N-acetylglucosamine transferase (SPINDLY family)
MDTDVNTLLHRGLDEYRRGALDAAQASFLAALAVDADNFDALNLLGVAVNQAGRPSDAVQYFERALRLRDNNPGLFSNLGMALRALGRAAEAVAAYDRAIALVPDFAAAHTNRGGALMDLRRFAEAIAAFDRSLAIRPDHADTLYLKARALNELDRQAEALAVIRKAVELKPNWPEAQAALADTLKDLKRFDESIAAYRRVLELRPGYPFLSGAMLRQQTKVCDWTDYDAQLSALEAMVARDEPALYPFASLTLLHSPPLQLKVARQYSKTLEQPLEPFAPTGRTDDRIHVGYFSADFRRHPMMHLMGEVFAMHDRDRFRITAFAFNVGKGDDYTQLARDSVDEYIDVDHLSDSEVAALARKMHVDIAIDRKGYTEYARTGIFARRAAPLQVNYLAYPGTMGADFIDYIIADATIIPRTFAKDYAEKIVWMPDSYSPRDTRLVVPGNVTRRDVGLPEDGFVFCCFNQLLKVTPAVFSNWMSILSQATGSVLWLLDEGPIASGNLRREAAARGVDPERILFAPKLPQAEHLERLRLADLGLDTLPYNAHTTANDALFVGVPFVTQIGESFAARVCASLLKAVDLPELVVENAEDFVRLGVELAHNPERMANLRQRLVAARTNSRLYDTRRYVDALESAYVQMHERRLAGLPPDHLTIEA